MLPALETARLRLRPYSEADIPELLPLIGVREVAATTLRIAHPYTEQDAKEFLALTLEPGKVWLATTLRIEGRQIGGVGLRVDDQHQNAELGYWLGVSFKQYNEHRYLDCIASARHALRLRPPVAEAYNNIGAAFGALHRWDEAIAADVSGVSRGRHSRGAEERSRQCDRL